MRFRDFVNRGVRGKYFGRVAERYDEREKQEQWIRQDKAFERFFAQASETGGLVDVLDLPCGTGRWLPFLPQRVAYTGVDFSADMVARARGKAGQSLRPRFVVADAFGYLGGDPGRFDLVISTRFLPFFSQRDAQGLVKKLCGVSRGFVVLDVKVRDSPLLREVLDSKRGRQLLRDRWRRLTGKDITQSHRRRSLLRVIGRSGFGLVDVEVIAESSWSRREMWLLARR